jgi:hypothetical protein
MSRAEMWDKFEDCASRALPRERLPLLFDLLYAIDELDDINVLTRQLETGNAATASP